MSQRYMCPSVGAMARPLPQRVVTASRCSRGFYASARRLDDQPGNSSNPASSPAPQREPRRQRNANAAAQITNLESRRTLPERKGLAGGIFPSGRHTQDSGNPQDGAATTPSGPKTITPTRPLIRRTGGDGGSAPPGNMVRAPSTLRITRSAGPGAPQQRGSGAPPQRGPNLRGRSGPPGRAGPGRAPNRGGEAGPQKRERQAGGGGGGDEPRIDQDVMEPNQIDSMMVQHLLRIQRGQWDRKPYTPKYAPGSFEANELIHAGRELFRGEAPPVKVWGRLERVMNVVGMHGAEAELKVRRVPDGDDVPFGQEHEGLIEPQKEGAEPKIRQFTA